MLAAVDRRIVLVGRLAAAISDPRDSRYITHPLRGDPLFKLSAGRTPLGNNNLLACGATFSRLENALSSRDIYRMARALALQFIAGYSCAPASITLPAGILRAQAEGWIKQVKCDLKADRTSASTFLANFGRLLLTAAAYVLYQQSRPPGLHGTALATVQPKAAILHLFKIAARAKQYKDRVLQRLAGHTNPAMTERYIRLRETPQAEDQKFTIILDSSRNIRHGNQ